MHRNAMYTKRLCLLALLLLACSVGYMTFGSRGNWAFVLPFRGNKLTALLLVAVAISSATLLFQTISQNRILTPSIMGFDTLYILILTVLIFTFGGLNNGQIAPIWQFALNTVLMMFAALLLFGTLLSRARSDLPRMILTGIVFAVLFRALTEVLQRMIDPNEYSVVQANSFAKFSRINVELLTIAAAITGAALLAAWRMRHRLDVLALGHDAAINLGESSRRCMFEALIIIAVLVSVSTALVGPMAFLGLIVVSLAYLVTPTGSHAVLLISGALISCITLVGGQFVLERLFGLSTPLAVIIDGLGGVLFLILLLRGWHK